MKTIKRPTRITSTNDSRVVHHLECTVSLSVSMLAVLVHSSRAANMAVCQIPRSQNPRSPRTVPDLDQQAVGSESHNPPLPLLGATKKARPESKTPSHLSWSLRLRTWPDLDLVWVPQRTSVLISAPSGDEHPSDLQFPHLSSRTQLLGFPTQKGPTYELLTVTGNLCLPRRELEPRELDTSELSSHRTMGPGP